MQRLSNGLRVVIVERHAVPLVSVQLWYGTGSAAEGTLHGLCHVARTALEHRDDAALRLRAAGVQFTSRTLPDACCFCSTAPLELFDFVLDIEARRLRPFTLTGEALERARQAAARTPGSATIGVRGPVERELLAAAYAGHPYGHHPELVVDRLARLDVDDVAEFMERWFVPGNATLVIVGDVSEVAVLEQVRRRFGEVPWAEPPRQPEPPALADASVHQSAPAGDTPRLDVAWCTPRAGLFENAALDVLMQHLTNPVDGTLVAALAGRGATIRSWRRKSWDDGGLLRLSVELSPEGATAAEVERAIRAELERVANAVPAEVALNRARSLAAGAVRRSRAGFADAAFNLGWHELVPGDVLLADYELPRVLSVTAGDLQEAALELLAARSVWRGPGLRASEAAPQHRVGQASRLPSSPRNEEMSGGTPDPPDSPEADSQVRMPDLPENGPRALTPAEGESAETPALPTLLVPKKAERLDVPEALALLEVSAADAPLVHSPTSPPTVSRFEPVAGVRLVVCPLAGVGVVEVVTLGWPAGAMWEVAASPLCGGSTRHSAEQVRDYLSYHGITFRCVDGRCQSGLRGQGPPDRVAQMVELQAELLRWPAEQAEATKSLRDVLIVVVGDVRPADIAEAAKLVWGDWKEPTAEVPDGTSDSLKSVGWQTPVGQDVYTLYAEFLNLADIPQPRRRLLFDVATRMFGGPEQGVFESAWIDGERRWSWTATGGSWLEAAVLCADTGTVADSASDAGGSGGTDGLPGATGGLLTSVPTSGSPAAGEGEREGSVVLRMMCLHIDRLRLERMAAEIVPPAVRLARAERLIRLGEPAFVAELLAAGVENPWDLVDSCGLAEIVADLPAVFREPRSGSDSRTPKAWRQRLERLSESAADTVRPPASP
ncbi:MAG: pitrilysin family protein [Phycisphaerae bacterium]